MGSGRRAAYYDLSPPAFHTAAAFCGRSILSRSPRVGGALRAAFPPHCRRSVARAQVEHALGCVVRLVRCVLGPDSVSEKKMEFGSPLVVFGMELEARACARLEFLGHAPVRMGGHWLGTPRDAGASKSLQVAAAH